MPQNHDPNQQPEPALRFRMRTMLIVVTLISIELAIVAPWLKEWPAPSLRGCFVFAVTALLMFLWNYFFIRFRQKRFREEHIDKFHLKAVMPNQWWSLIPILLAIPIVIILLSDVVSSDPSGGYGYSMFGVFVGGAFVTLITNMYTYYALTLKGLEYPGHTTRWQKFRRVYQTSRPNVMCLKKRFGEFCFVVPPKQREEVLTLIEVKTGHTLETYAEKTSSRANEA